MKYSKNDRVSFQGDPQDLGVVVQTYPGVLVKWDSGYFTPYNEQEVQRNLLPVQDIFSPKEKTLDIEIA